MDYDLAVIGAGWAGFNACLRAKELGLKVCLIEKNEIGGTCLNRGCIPTKTLIYSSKVYSICKKASLFGIETSPFKVNFAQVRARKNKIIQQLRQGMEFSLKGVDYIKAEARILSPNRLKIGEKELNIKSILIATGSKPFELSNFKFDGKKIFSSDDILELEIIPASLLIIGGGVIGCEFASLFNAFGTEVTIAEKLPQLLPNEDAEIAKKLETIFKKRKIKINTATDANTLNLDNFELVLVCVGRVPQTAGLGLEQAGIKLDRGKITVDDFLKTTVPDIYSAGDCCSKIMLAHFAAYQGRIAAENIARPDLAKKADNPNVPNCIFTDPEVASVGLTEAAAKNKGIEIEIKRFDFLASGMARILEEAEGFLKIISAKKTGEILGAVIIGPRATELIATLTMAVTSHLSLAQVREIIFAHPSLSEVIGETLK